MSVIKGGDLMLFVNGKSIGFSTSHTLSISAETKETTSKDSGGKWQSSEAGILSWNCSSESLVGDKVEGIGYDELFEMMISRKKITGVFALEGNSSNFDDGKLDKVKAGGWTPKSSDGYTGEMLLTSLEKTAQNGENATFKAEFQGVGELKKVGSTTSQK